MAIGQKDTASGEALRPETKCELLRGSLAAAVGIDIEGEIDRAWAVAQLLKLIGVQMRTQRAGDMTETRLPQHGVVEQPLDENHFGALLNMLPGIQATLRAGKESMGEGSNDTAAVEVDDASTLAAREDDAPIEGVAALRIEQAETQQEIKRIALSRKMTAQDPARGITNPQFFDQGRIAQSSLRKIALRFNEVIELRLIKSDGLLEDGGRVGGRSALLLEVGEALTEGQMAG